MKIYLAAMWSMRMHMVEAAERLTAQGHTITSRWLNDAHTQGTEAECAQIDLDDIDAADAILFFSAGPRGTMFSGGGRCIEFGYAIARRKSLILIGKPESVFHMLPQVTIMESLVEFLGSHIARN